ncbi:hypothetical protein QEG98_13790 [Myxococcus sp. MxC21-1]|uniref:hypothetical protein n=1 Tax=Myxococcus sp. MxC21-1 TaxID=3041439 RepID=UPI00292D3804|nr:hypothetical protein [Myxococcus sp. MxC21-1]WNZ64645.1 hypothetical protein QEG98_13790 [Myxococcus sp. MxC21-1]
MATSRSRARNVVPSAVKQASRTPCGSRRSDSRSSSNSWTARRSAGLGSSSSVKNMCPAAATSTRLWWACALSLGQSTARMERGV